MNCLWIIESAGIPKLNLVLIFHFFIALEYNNPFRQELKEFEEQEKQNRMMHQEDVLRKRLEEYARRNHYLVSTEVIPGIYNSPFRM